MHPEGWDDVLRRLLSERLTDVASAIGMEEFELTAYLVVDGAGKPAESTPWWPEALAMRAEGQSLREIARRFQTEPRRIRRGLARTALRVAGQDVAPGAGAPALAAARERLGAEPDRVVAKATGVAVEAVKGERRRLAVAPFFQRPRVRLTADDEAWIRGPKKLRRERFRPEPDVLQVVRRPTTRPGEEVRSSPPEVFPRRVETRPLPPPRSVDTRSSFFRDDRRAEIERLIEPTVRRDGNRRLVRSPEPARTVAPPTPEVTRRVAPEPVRAEVEAPRALPSLPSTGTRRIVAAPRPVGSPVAPSRAAAVAVAVAPVAVTGPEEVAWRVEVPGWEQTLTVFASDIAGAVRKAAEKVPPQLLARASVWRADQPPPGPDHL